MHKNYKSFLESVVPSSSITNVETLESALNSYSEAVCAQEELYEKHELKSDQFEYIKRIESVFMRMCKRIGTLQLVQVFSELRRRIEHFVIFSEEIFDKKADEVKLKMQLDLERQ